MNFNELCHKLELDPESKLSEAHQRSKIENWCRANISSSLQLLGTEQEKFESYLKLAQFYLDTFLKNPTVHVAAARGFDKYLETVSQSKLNEVDENGFTALHRAAQAGQVETTKLLLAKGADPLRQNKQLQVPLYSALQMPVFFSPDLRNRKIDIERLLIENKKDILNHKDSSGDTILHRIVAPGFFELIEETLEQKPELLHISNKHGHYPIHTAILNRRKECVQRLMSYPDVELQKDAEQQTPLEYAFKLNDPDLISICVNALTDVNRRNVLGETPLLLAAGVGNHHIFERLMSKGADIHAVDMNGNAVLHCAVLSGNIDMVSWLLARSDIDKSQSNKNGQTPLDLCKNDDIRRLFLGENGAEMTAI